MTISGLTDTNMTVGTVDYAAPEQLMGERLDGRADQYSLAATAYHLLTGTRAFDDSNAAVVISRHLNTEPPSSRRHATRTRGARPVLAAALAKDPDDRFATCSDFARALAATGVRNAQCRRPQRQPRRRRSNDRAKSQVAPKRNRASSPLSPGWYPDPSGTGLERCTGTAEDGALRRCRRAGRPDPTSPGTSGRSSVAIAAVVSARGRGCSDHRSGAVFASEPATMTARRPSASTSAASRPSPRSRQPTAEAHCLGVAARPSASTDYRCTAASASVATTSAVLERDSSSAPATRVAPAA